MLLLLRTSDGSYGSHAITKWNGMIFDSTSPHALRWSQRSLDWCSGKDSTCIGFIKVYRLCPKEFGKMLPNCTIQIGTQVQSHLMLSHGCLGWISRLPTYRITGEQKKGYIVHYVDGTSAELSHSEVCKYELQK